MVVFLYELKCVGNIGWLNVALERPLNNIEAYNVDKKDFAT